MQRRGITAARAMALALLAGLAACTSAEQTAAEASARYDARFAAGDIEGARTEIQDALKARDDVSDYWVKLGRAELALRNYPEAYQAYLRGLELDQANSEALQNVAELSLVGGLLPDARKYADQILAFAPNSLRAHIIKGSVFVRQRKFDDADEMADLALKLAPTDEAALLLKAQVMGGRGDNAGAAAYVERALVGRAPSVGMLTTLAGFYREADDRAGTERTYARLLKLSPDNVDLRLAYARQLYLDDQGARALAALDTLQRARAQDGALVTRIAELWREVGGAAAGTADIRRFAARTSPAGRLALARYALDEGQPGEAVRLLDPLLGGAIGPDNAPANALYARAEHALGRAGAGLARAERVLAFDQTNPQALLVRGRILMEQGRLEPALIDAQVAARDNPNMADARILLGQAYARGRQTALADATFRRAAQDLPANGAVLDAYVAFLAGRGREGAAVRLAETFARANPRLVAGWRALGQLCLGAGERACAQTAITALAQVRGGDPVARQLAGRLGGAAPDAGQAG